MKAFLSIALPVFFLSLFVFATIYMSRRFGWYFGASSPKGYYWFFSLLVIIVLFINLGLTMATSGFAHIVYMISGVLLGLLTYLFFFTLLIDLIGLFVKVKPLYSGIASIGLATLVTAYGLIHAGNIRMTSIDVPIQGLTRPVKAMHLSDIHMGHYWSKAFFQQVMDLTNKQNPEVIFFTGDLFDSRYALKDSNLDPLNNLDIPFFFVEGNHDVYTGVEEIKEMVRRKGVIVLENETTSWGEFQIIGLNHMLADDEAFDMHATDEAGETVKSVLEKLDTDPDKPTILLHHSPDGDQYAEKAGVDLFLAGHTHGGQMFPGTLFAEALFKYNRGIHDFKSMKIFVSLGAGTFGPPLRVGTFSEITIVNLIPK